MSDGYQSTFRNLIGWQKAKVLAKTIYELTSRFPKEELYGLTSQMRRAAVSIMSNLAEGNQRAGRKERLYFFNIAYGSLAELDSQFDLSHELGFLKEADYNVLLEQLNKTGYFIFKLINSLKTPHNLNSPHNPNNPNSPHNPNNPNNPNGFTLAELVVVVAVAAVMAVGAVAGFGQFGKSLSARQAAGAIQDTVHRLELEVLAGEHSLSTLHFAPTHLVAVSEGPDSQPWLQWEPKEIDPCLAGQQKLILGHSGSLLLRNEREQILELRAVADGQFHCFDFSSAKDNEWQWQLEEDGQSSGLIRFIHFELDPDRRGALLLGPKGYRLRLEEPYGARQLFKEDKLLAEPL